MLVVTAALQVSEQIKGAGAYAGFASILGLAVLSLLYFGQARELKRLRDWAGRAPERTAELQGQAMNLPAAAAAQRRGVPQPPPAARAPARAPATAAGAAARPVAGHPVTAAGLPVAPPSGRAAPGPGDATPGVAAPGASTPAGTPPAASPGASPGNGAPPAAPGGGQDTQSIPAVGAAPRPRTAPTPPPRTESPVPLRQVNAVPGRQSREAGAGVWPPADQESAGRPSGSTVAKIVGVMAAVLVAAVLVSQVVGGGDDPSTTGARTPTTATDNEFVPPPATAPTDTAPPVDPGDFAVYVLNGTRQVGLAAEVAGTLEADGYRTAGASTALEDTAPRTEIFYLEGKKPGAVSVAEDLEVSPANVKAVEPEISAQGPGADVIVQIGADKATP